MIDCWKSLLPSQTKRGPHGVLLVVAANRSGRALPVVISVGRCIDRAVAIDAGDRRGVARFAVELAVAVNIDVEMAIGALHSVREMHVFQVNRFRKFLRIVVRNLVVVADRAGCLCDRV